VKAVRYKYTEDPACAACGAGTGSVFSVAKKLKRLLDKKWGRAKKRRREWRRSDKDDEAEALLR